MVNLWERIFSANKKVTIVIVTYNGRRYLPECLASLEHQDYPKNLVKIVVVDNHSTDSTVNYLQEVHPEVKVVINRKNLGFAAANNQGYFLAQKNQSDYLVLLNQDTIVEKNWLKRLVRLAEKDKKIAAVQPKILLYPQTQLINSLGNSIHFLGFAFCNHYREKNQSVQTEPFFLPYASGAACLLKISALKEVGLFDERLFMYHEDVDLGWRLNLAGYRVAIDPLAVIYHQYTYSKAKYKFYYMERNRLVVTLQNYRLLTLLLFLPAFLVMEIGILFFAFKNDWLKEKLKGYVWIFYHWPSILARRLKVQFLLRKTKDRDLLRNFTGAIKFQEINNPILLYLVNPLMSFYFYLAKKIIFW